MPGKAVLARTNGQLSLSMHHCCHHPIILAFRSFLDQLTRSEAKTKQARPRLQVVSCNLDDAFFVYALKR